MTQDRTDWVQPEPNEVRVMLNAKPLLGSVTAVTEDGAAELPMIFLRIDGLTAGKTILDALEHDGPPDETFKFALPAESARMLARNLDAVVDRTQDGNDDVSVRYVSDFQATDGSINPGSGDVPAVFFRVTSPPPGTPPGPDVTEQAPLEFAMPPGAALTASLGLLAALHRIMQPAGEEPPAT